MGFSRTATPDRLEAISQVRYVFHTQGAAAATTVAADKLQADQLSCFDYLDLCKWSEGREGMGPRAW